eukprot:sb/3476033/
MVNNESKEFLTLCCLNFEAVEYQILYCNRGPSPRANTLPTHYFLKCFTSIFLHQEISELNQSADPADLISEYCDDVTKSVATATTVTRISAASRMTMQSAYRDNKFFELGELIFFRCFGS